MSELTREIQRLLRNKVLVILLNKLKGQKHLNFEDTASVYIFPYLTLSAFQYWASVKAIPHQYSIID